MNIPENLIDVELLVPPLEIVELASKFGVENVRFVDSAKLSNSLRCNNDIFINVRGTYWANYISPPWNAKTFGEAILLRILHEIGHVVNKHTGENVIISKTGMTVERKSDFWETAFTGQEEEAWSFAFGYRRDFKQDYLNYKVICDEWTETRVYTDKDWYDDAKSQFFLRHKKEIDKVLFNIPEWVNKLYKDSYI